MIFHEIEYEKRIAEILPNHHTIRTTDDVTDIIGNCYGNDCMGVIIPKEVLHDDFFELKTRLAGELLQKFVTYKIRLAIVGDFSNISGKSLHDFIYESNRGRAVFFVPSNEEALKVLGK